MELVTECLNVVMASIQLGSVFQSITCQFIPPLFIDVSAQMLGAACFMIARWNLSLNLVLFT